MVEKMVFGSSTKGSHICSHRGDMKAEKRKAFWGEYTISVILGGIWILTILPQFRSSDHPS